MFYTICFFGQKSGNWGKALKQLKFYWESCTISGYLTEIIVPLEELGRVWEQLVMCSLGILTFGAELAKLSYFSFICPLVTGSRILFYMTSMWLREIWWMRRGPLGISCVLIGCFSAPLKFLDISLWSCCDTFVHQIFSSIVKQRINSEV